MRIGNVEQQEQVTHNRKEGAESAESRYCHGLGDYDLAVFCQMSIKRKAYLMSSLYCLGLLYY